MRKVLVAALGALALAGCVHHEGPHRGAGYAYGGYGYHQPAFFAPPRRSAGYQPFFTQPNYRRVEDRRHWGDHGGDRWRDRRQWGDHGGDRWRDRRHQRDGWWRGG